MTIQEIHTESLDDFWNLLSPIGEFLKDKEFPLFRGQGNHLWNLTPSIMRDAVVKKYAKEHECRSHSDFTILVEYRMLRAFLDSCDEMGYQIPNDSQEFRDAMSFESFAQRHSISLENWPSNEYYSFLALSQHHGIPTRLLDWSRNPYVAAYFAVAQWLNSIEKSEKIAVWIIDERQLHKLNGQIVFLSLPGSTSKNLAAQKGVFTFHRQNINVGRNTHFSIEQLDTIVKNIFHENDNIIATKIILKSNLSSDLLFRCNKFGISAASMFPGLEGAAHSALEWKIAHKFSNKI